MKEPAGSPPPVDGRSLGGTLTKDTTLTAADGPYAFGSTLEVPAGVTLTIEPGTTLLSQATPCCSPVSVLIRAAGTVVVGAVDGDPVVVDTSASNYGTPTLFAAIERSSTADFDIHGLRTVSNNPLWGGGTAAAFAMAGSTISGYTAFDNTQSDLTFDRNVFNGGYLEIIGPWEGHASITRNRFRASSLRCDGRGSLAAAGNTFERGLQWHSGSSVSSSGDCRLDVSGNHWETTDDLLSNRIQGAARVVWRPTASAPETGTPVIAPAQHSQSYSTDSFGRVFLDVQTGSDGGAAASVTAYATERESGDDVIVEKHELPAASRTSSTSERFAFTKLEPGKLYALHSYVENEQGETDVQQTESFLAPEPNGGVPPIEGKTLGGVLAKDTTLTAAGGPYVFASTLTVPAGITLTIEPGVHMSLGEGCCIQDRTLIRVAGRVVAGAASGPRVRFDIVANNAWYDATVFGPLGDSRSAVVDVTNAEFVGGNGYRAHVWGGRPYDDLPFGSFESLSFVDSHLNSADLTLGESTGRVLLSRNAFDEVRVEARQPESARLEISDNRFRRSTLSCSGTGRLEARGNTFEAFGGHVASNDSCVLDVSGNHWETPDNEIRWRIEAGRLRTITTPTIAEPTPDTPTMTPGGFTVGIDVDQNNEATASASLGSTGGADTDVVLKVIEMDSGDVVLSKTFAKAKPNESMELPVTALTVNKLYRVTGTATNSQGSVEAQGAESFLFPAPAPTQPTNVKATASGQSITVTWAPPTDDGGNPVRTYSVRNEYTGDLRTVDGTARSVTFTDLDWSSHYEFTVVASSDVGTSRPATVSATTPAEPSTGGGTGGGGGTTPPQTGGGGGGGGGAAPAPTGKAPLAPTSVVAKPGDESATVTWSPAEANGSPVTGYTVTASPGGRTAEGTATTATVTGLTNGTAYTFTVTATNAAGTSEPSAPSVAVVPVGKPEAPSAVSTVTGDRTLAVSWSAPATGSPATAYVASLSPSGATREVTGAERTVSFDGLTNGTTYTATVVARNTHGDGPAATATGIPAGKPGTPSDVTPNARAGSVRLTWTAPDTNGSRVTGYTIRVSPTGRTIDVPAGRTSAVVDGLRNGRRYLFELTAANAIGVSEAVQVMAKPLDAPERVASPKAVVKKNGRVVVKWTAPSTNGSPLIRYVVRSNRGDVMKVDGATTRAVFNRLAKGRAYRFHVVAVNAVGRSDRGEKSAPVKP